MGTATTTHSGSKDDDHEDKWRNDDTTIERYNKPVKTDAEIVLGFPLKKNAAT